MKSTYSPSPAHPPFQSHELILDEDTCGLPAGQIQKERVEIDSRLGPTLHEILLVPANRQTAIFS